MKKRKLKINQFDHPNVVEQRKLHESVLKEVRSMTPEEGFKDLIKSGIYTADGQLAPEYGGPPRKKKQPQKRNEVMSDEHVVEMAKRKLDFIRQQVSVGLFNCRYRQIERDIEWIREEIGKGELTFEVIGTTDEELKKLDKDAFELREKN